LKVNTIFKGSVPLLVLGGLIYSNTFLNAFHFDDFPSIVNNVAIRDIHHLHRIWSFWPTRFITYFSFALNYHWGGISVCGYHVLSLLIHLMTSILVWRLMILTFNTPMIRAEAIAAFAPWIAFFTAAIFLTHPLQTQAVNYIVQRAVLLAAFFYIASLVLYIQSNLEIASKRRRFYYTGSMLCAVLSMLSKENAVSLPLMICFYQWFFFTEQKAFEWKKVFPFFLVILIIPLVWLPHHLGGIGASVAGFAQGRTVEQYALTQGKVILTYLRLLILPIHQRVEYDYTPVSSFFDASAQGSVFLLLLILGAAGVLKNRFRLASFGIFWFFITLMPESSFWPITDLIFEHRLYLPLVGFGVFLSSGLFYLLQERRAYLSIRILFIFVIAYSVLTYQRNKIWKNEFTLWDDAVHQSPNSPRAYLNRGAAYQNTGDLDHALADYNMAIGLGPVEPVTLSNRGLIFEKKGKFDLALANFNLAIEINSGYVGTYVNRGKLYQIEGKLEQAEKDFNKAVALAPNDAGGYVARGLFYAGTGDFNHAILDYNAALMIQPGNSAIYGYRAEAYFLKKDYDQCWQDVHRVENLGSSIKPEYLQALQKASGRKQ